MSTDYPREKARKNILVRGFHNTLEDDGFELVTTSGPAMPTLPTAVGTLKVVSSSVSDAAAATAKVVIDYLDTNWDEKRAVFLIDGTTEVTQGKVFTGTTLGALATISAIRVNKVWCSGFANAGTISVKIGTVVFHEVPIGHQIGGTCMYTVPNGQQAVCRGIYVSASEKCTVRLREHVHGDGQVLTTVFTFNAAGTQYIPFPNGRRLDRQNVDESWSQSKVTWLADANCLTASVTAAVEIGLDLEVTRTDTTSPGFRY
jgi:hypothetical protein